VGLNSVFLTLTELFSVDGSLVSNMLPRNVQVNRMGSFIVTVSKNKTFEFCILFLCGNLSQIILNIRMVKGMPEFFEG